MQCRDKFIREDTKHQKTDVNCENSTLDESETGIMRITVELVTNLSKSLY